MRASVVSLANDTPADLRSVLASFPGIVAATDATGSHAHLEADRVVLALAFEKDMQGRTAALTVDQILSRLGNGTRLDGRAPVTADAALACDCTTPDATFYALSKAQVPVFARVLCYAMDMGYDPYRDAASEPSAQAEAVSGEPLFVLLSHAFETLCRIYAGSMAGDGSEPSLGVWSNVLRPFDDETLDRHDLIRRGVISRRAVRALIRDLERLRWLTVEKPARGQTLLRLTAAGRHARAAGTRLAGAAERGFASRFGADRTAALREALATVVNQFEIELPWFLTGYGLADSSLTGGSHVPEHPGPPRTPAHGADWPVVLRDHTSDANEQPLSALLSKALAAFRIEYERRMLGHGTGLDFVANFLRFVDDDGMALKTASEMGGVTGNGRSALERHLVVVAEPPTARGLPRGVYLTPKGKQARDAYPYLVNKTERDWRDRYGDCVAELRSTLAFMDRDFGPDLPNYPSTTDWLYRSMLAGSAPERG